MKAEFLEEMKELLGDDYNEYVKTLDEERYQGIRLNLLKNEKEKLERTFDLVKSPFSDCGYYAHNISGNHPYHLQGLFYIQEVSATSVIQIADIKPNDWVLDLCAAPGGKSSDIAGRLNNTGLLVSNEIISKRANILLSNLERMGVSENIITSAKPQVICEEMSGCFDKVIVDAPCSGEGMFKKHDQALNDWSKEYVLACAKRQQSILDEAYKALKTAGILVYSTCTYAKEENEMVVYNFLKKYPDMELINIDVDFGRCGYPYKDLDYHKLRRILPMDHGEGHFICKMQKKSITQAVKLTYLESEQNMLVDAFLNEHLKNAHPYSYINNNKVYIKNTPFIKLKKTKILRQGILVGEIVKNRLEAQHSFYLASILEDKFKHVIDIDNDELVTFISGNVLNHPCEKGYVGIRYEKHLIGFGKSDGLIIKNKYPKGLRRNIKISD